MAVGCATATTSSFNTRSLACSLICVVRFDWRKQKYQPRRIPEQWPQILRWAAAGEEVEVTAGQSRGEGRARDRHASA